MKTRAIYLLLLLTLSTLGCVGKEKGIKGDKNIVTRTIQVETIKEIHLGSRIEVTRSVNPFSKKNHAVCDYTQMEGPASVEITMDENLFDYLETKDKNGKFTIRAQAGKKLYPSRLEVRISSEELEKVVVDGCFDFIADQPVRLTDATLHVNGVGDIHMTDVSCESLKANVSGVGNIHLGGNVKEGKYTVSGVGHIYASDCPTESLKCDVSGVGGMEVNVIDSLDASTSGVGSITYKGNPEHTKLSASGVGKIKQAD